MDNHETQYLQDYTDTIRELSRNISSDDYDLRINQIFEYMQPNRSFTIKNDPLPIDNINDIEDNSLRDLLLKYNKDIGQLLIWQVDGFPFPAFRYAQTWHRPVLSIRLIEEDEYISLTLMSFGDRTNLNINRDVFIDFLDIFSNWLRIDDELIPEFSGYSIKG